MFIELWKDGQHVGRITFDQDGAPRMREVAEAASDELSGVLYGGFTEEWYVRLADTWGSGIRTVKLSAEMRTPEWFAAAALYLLPQRGYRCVIDTDGLDWSKYEVEKA